MKSFLKENKHHIMLTVSCLFFVIGNSIALYKEFIYFPLISVIAVAFYLFFFKLDWLLSMMAFSVPLSVSLSEYTKLPVDLSLPSEVIMMCLTLLFFGRSLSGISYDKKLLKNPITIAICLYLVWLLLTSITSTLPGVSIKFWISKLWFIVSCFFVLVPYFTENKEHILKFFGSYALGLSIVVIITTIRHAGYQFSEEVGHWIMSPFYNDHTAYGAALAFFLPITVGFAFFDKSKKGYRFFFLIMSAIILGGLYLSFCRAAWLSVVAAIGVWVVLKLKIKFSWLITGIAILGLVFYTFSDDILYQLSKNKQDASGNLTEQIQSMSNISTDASNVERLNRWYCAIEMIKEKPFWGWGPGTYQFKYAPYQNSKYQTIISTDFGDGGNAHSEYLGQFAETGTIGFLSLLVLIVLILYQGITTYIRSYDKKIRLLTLCITLSLITYFIHGFMNNFLDTDKLALPFWACFAAIVSLNYSVPQHSDRT
ncbi:MAG: O-antigen ligase family protein [Bacteroidales bacterium]|jgi:O-antigen ligase|nr:O-antigen ligase family protein [Bacteroidales bacterium]